MSVFHISSSCLDRVCSQLSIKHANGCSFEYLSHIYKSWCEQVPFDNLAKIVRLSADPLAPLPGAAAQDFFECWLNVGVGGTCWAGNGALFALLGALGYEVEFVAGNMLPTLSVTPSPPAHGAVIVKIEGAEYLLDATILHGVPIKIAPHETRCNTFYYRVLIVNGEIYIRWRPLGRPFFYFHLNRRNLSEEYILESHKKSRVTSKFNGSPIIRIVRSGSIHGVVKDSLIVRDPVGDELFEDLAQFSLSEELHRKFGICHQFANQLVRTIEKPE